MLKPFLLITILFFATDVFAQNEFKTYKNGLIYNESAMKKLEHIVDSLNLKYKVCDFNKVFYSIKQTIGNIIKLDTANIKEAKKDLMNNISFEDFIKKYPYAEVETDALIIKYKYQDYNENEAVEVKEIKINHGYGLTLSDNIDNYNKPVKNSWLFEYIKKSDYSKESLKAFYFKEDFESKPLKANYCRQIGYSDCLIDTSTTKFKKDTKEGWVDLPKDWQTLTFNKKSKLLEEMRSTRVIGGCSQDSRPREHAVNIAMLSAETTNWEVFLKAHLDIMNDRFDRVSDGSYAYAKRNTYIKELEELNINVLDLLIGIFLRVENSADNHYYGSINRLGRAIAESKNRIEFTKQILSMIEDNELDYYNRILSLFLFKNLNSCLDDKIEQKNNQSELLKSISKLPVFLKTKLK